MTMDLPECTGSWKGAANRLWRWAMRKGRVWREPRNPSYDPIPGYDSRVLRGVVGVLCLS